RSAAARAAQNLEAAASNPPPTARTVVNWQSATARQGELMAAEVRLVDLAVIKRYSLAVRQERAPAEEVLEALEDSAAVVIAVLDDGSLRVDVEAVESAAAEGVPVDGSLRVPAFGGLLRFLTHVDRRRAPIKVQLTGPVTLGLALTRSGVPGRAAFALAVEAVRARARALLDHVARHAPGAPVVVFVDEPSLAVVGHPGFPLPSHAVVDMLTAALASLHDAAATGIHC